MNVTPLEELPTPNARQQPPWEDPAEVERVRKALAALPPLVETESLGRLRQRLAEVAAGQAQVVQAGDCAEDPAESTAADAERKTGLLDELADVMNAVTRQPVVRVGTLRMPVSDTLSDEETAIGSRPSTAPMLITACAVIQ
ncbi:3-deoxy-7-phosphoheptulonate synthase, partial [Streptomyces sp. NPDC006324]|uniref:3-deoxy-7-phosphoheptulonate synthase n=1 Tax=Streptomyces sp. NPDC006324 TaxID=3156751 RepID=UPI0033ABCD04